MEIDIEFGLCLLISFAIGTTIGHWAYSWVSIL